MMTIKTLLFTIISSFIIAGGAYASNTNTSILPPDSSSTIIDRAAAVFLIDEGKKSLNNGRTRDALQKFREAFVKDQYSSKAAYWIGEAHYALDNYGYALRYGKISESLSEATDGDVFFLLAKSYHRQNELDSAKMNYELADIQLPAAKKRAFNIKKLMEEVDFAKSLEGQETKYQKVLLDDQVNSGYDDYAPLLTNGGKSIYFVSRRPDTKGGNINPDDQRYFEDIYMSEWDEQHEEWKLASNDLGRLNSEGFDAINYISADGTEAYLTVNTSILNIKKPTKSSDICVATLNSEGVWSTPRPINNKSINTSFFDGAPTLTADENTMYFVSDRDGSKSKSDIYMVSKEGRSWGKAQKLPMNVNTVGNETTPYITPDNKYLFFSSNGHVGMGGYDIYVTKNLGNNTWSDPVNLGPEFNTVNDDIFFKYFPDINKAVLSTYRLQGQQASMDIYEILLEGWEIPKTD